jgi:anti-sigma regulatory factor (Ser/Thr protein kinase)
MGTAMPDELDLRLPRDETAGNVARSAIRARFGEQLEPDRIGELSLVATELVTNAVMHGHGDITLKLRVDGDSVYGEVVDEGGGFEREVREQGPDELNGRGLMIVDALSRRWGIHEGTTHVWFELAETPMRFSGGLPDPELGEDERPPGLDDTP